MARSGYQLRSPVQVAQHREIIARRYLRGESQARIAADLGISQQTVSRDLQHIQQGWLESALRDFDELKAKELARIDELEATYWQAWKASKGDRTRRRQIIDVNTTRPKEIVVDSEDSAGDPRYLEGVQWCIEQRCKILGFHAPQRSLGVMGVVVPNGANGQNVDHTSNPEISSLAHRLLAAVTGED